MLHIILILLKIIGILLLIIIGILILLLFCLLFVPVRYKAFAEGKDTNWNLRGNVSWLAHIISVHAYYVEKQLTYEVYVFGIPMLKFMDRMKNHKNRKVISDATPDSSENAARKDAPDDEAEHIIRKEEKYEEAKTSDEPSGVRKKESISNTQKSSQGCEGAQDVQENQQIPESAETVAETFENDSSSNTEKPSFIEKILSAVNCIIHIPEKIYYTIHRVYDKIQAGIAILCSDEVQHLKKTIILYMKKILNHIKPRYIKGNLTYGFDDPALTGQVLGCVAVFFGFLPKKLVITPDFEERCLEGQITLSGRIFGICFAVWGLQILFDKKTIPAIKHVMHKEG